MAFMKFYVGTEASVQEHLDGIYLATDTHKIFYNGSAYGGSDVDLSSYATKAELDGYLPLSGGTLTGYLKMRELDGSELKNETFSLDLVQGYFDGKEAYMKFNVHPGDYSSNRTMIEMGNLINSNTAANSSDVLGIYSDFFQARFNPISKSFAVCNRPNTSKDVMWSNITLVPGDDDEAYVRITSYLGDSKDSSNFNQAIYKSTGITFRNKTASDLLHAAGGTISINELKSQLNIPDTSALQGAIGNNTYTGANYISKETNLTDAVLQLDTEIKATNDNLALEHTNAEATYAKKTELGKKLDISTYTSDKATFALKSEIPDVSNFLTISNAQSTYLTKTDARNNYQPKGNYLTSVSIATISDLNSGWDALLKAAPNIPSLNGYATQEWVKGRGFLTKTTADGYYQPKGNYLTSVSWSQVSDKPAFAAVATSGSYNDLTNKPTIPNVSTVNHSGTISLIIDSNTLSFRSDGIAFNGSTVVSFPVVEVLSTEEINQILNS